MEERKKERKKVGGQIFWSTARLKEKVVNLAAVHCQPKKIFPA